MAIAAALPFLLLVLLAPTQATLNGQCSVGSTPGVCIATADCTSGGGTYASGYCPNDPTDVKCCYKTSCDSGKGSCKWTSSCSGTSVAGYCPGPTAFQCCEAGGSSNNYGTVASYADAHWNCATAACTSTKEGGPLGLEDFLKASGWRTVSVTAANVQKGAVVFMRSWGHVVIGVGSNLIDSHNNARYHVDLNFYSGEGLLAIYVK
ncbi:hypothetical protein KFL_000880020 [Klebsormidium nitens]|uniref:Peptidase C39-like domain-containing protein n=1 Tax=Klebsormidium nitens TaxID=105231 RepID=A0A1Y1I0R2_KLENI|nr:hypothetical protein KFL_000880020 [Klebsormidium nitens]|eukprot:GAQ81688.1 hypothetical protein KFL_000880020 [Klebsormidium nitens]